MKPVVDRELCIGCGVCEEECPEVFELRDDGIAYVLREVPGHESYGCVQAAIEVCPVEAISVEG